MLEENDPLAHWIGKTEERRDELRAWPTAALHSALELDGAAPTEGDLLPPFWRWLYFLGAAKRGELGRDGHPALGQGLYPPLPSSRRMWAGGRVAFLKPVTLGAEATLVSRIADISRKNGRSGPLVFLTLAHELYVDGDDETPAEIEEQDIVYKEEAPAVALTDADVEIERPVGEPAPQDEVWRRAWSADPTLLFRYSALTYNGHRIHYDLDYCRRVEGYPSLVVHGPLLATLLLELARERGPERMITSFSFRAKSPIFDTEAFEACGKPTKIEKDGETVEGARLWLRAAGDSGRLAMTAEATFSAR